MRLGSDRGRETAVYVTVPTREVEVPAAGDPCDRQCSRIVFLTDKDMRSIQNAINCRDWAIYLMVMASRLRSTGTEL